MTLIGVNMLLHYFGISLLVSLLWYSLNRLVFLANNRPATDAILLHLVLSTLYLFFVLVLALYIGTAWVRG